MDYTETFYKRINGYRGLIINASLDRVVLSSGEHSLREVVEHPGGVLVIPVDAEGYVYCVRQFRYPIGEHLLEVPAGKLEPGEEPFSCAVRELLEETGISAETYTDLGKIYSSPGYSKEVLYIYMARDLSFGEARPDEGEFLDVEKIHIDRLHSMVMDNMIPDGKSAIAIMKAKFLLDSGR